MAFDYSELVELIRIKFSTHDLFAKALGIGRVSLSQRLNNKLEFSQAEMLKAAELLNIEQKEIPRYFFNEKVQKNEQKN